MDKDKRMKVYLKGYKEGQEEAWADIKSMLSKFDGWELKSRVESRIGTLYQEVESKKEELKENEEKLIFEEEGLEEEGEKRTTDVPWRPGDAYLFVENRLKAGIEVFDQVVRGGNPILLIVRDPPSKVMDGFDDILTGDNLKFVWLSRKKNHDEQRDENEIERISPGDLSGLSQVIGDFFGSHERAVVLLHGIPFLLNYNDEKKVLKLLHFTHDEATENNGCVVASISGNAVEEKFLEKVKGDFDRSFE
ncbi:MAG: DUF835 domain-containing protein [Candidatus Aenigmatarchaeota archaeon]